MISGVPFLRAPHLYRTIEDGIANMDLQAIDGIPSIEDVMTASPLFVEIDADIRAADDLMQDHDVRHLPVIEGGVLVGILSDRDIAAVWSVVNADPDKHIEVRSICSLDVYAVGVEEKLDHVLMEMAERRIGSAVVAKGEKIVGIFTATDACRCFGAFLRAHWPEGVGSTRK